MARATGDPALTLSEAKAAGRARGWWGAEAVRGKGRNSNGY